VLGGGSGGRYYADWQRRDHIVPDSRNQPAEFTETRFSAFGREARSAYRLRRRRSGAAAVRATKNIIVRWFDCRTIVTADRVRLGCYGLNGGKAGQPFCVTVDAEGEGL